MKVEHKIWLADRGKAFGKGPFMIMKAVMMTGSLRQAAISLGMSYTKAYQTIRTCEAHLPFKLIETQTGGALGGGSYITPQGKDLMEAFEGFQMAADLVLDDLYQVHLGPLFEPMVLLKEDACVHD